MFEHDETSASCRVFTYKEGLLTRVAHDLEIVVQRFRLHVDVGAGVVSGVFDARSLRVLHALVDGRASPTTLTAVDRSKIEQQMSERVLESERHPEVTFRSESLRRVAHGGYRVSGSLALHGARGRIECESQLEGGRQVVEIELDQRDYGITPFRALLGALRVQPVVRVRLEVPDGQ